MRKVIATVLVVLGLALIVVAFSVRAFPQWLSLPGGVLLLLVAAFVGVADLGGKLKDWRDFLFGEEKVAKGTAQPEKPTPERTQDMMRSEKGQQEMKGKGGVQKQNMTDSPGGKQKIE
jgi:hypothetical protein